MINIERLLVDLQIEYRNAGSENVKINCLNPAHDDNDPSMLVHRESGIIHCLHEDSLIQLKDKVKKIKDVVIGDFVFDIDGKLQIVTGKAFRELNPGELYKIKIKGIDIPLYITENHEILVIKAKRCLWKSNKNRFCLPTCTHATSINRGCSTPQFKDYKEEWVLVKDLENFDFFIS